MDVQHQIRRQLTGHFRKDSSALANSALQEDRDPASVDIHFLWRHESDGRACAAASGHEGAAAPGIGSSFSIVPTVRPSVTPVAWFLTNTPSPRWSEWRDRRRWLAPSPPPRRLSEPARRRARKAPSGRDTGIAVGIPRFRIPLVGERRGCAGGMDSAPASVLGLRHNGRADAA